MKYICMFFRSEYPVKRARVERSSSVVDLGPESPSLSINHQSQKHKTKQPDPYDFNDDEQSINPATVSKRMFRSSRDEYMNKKMVCLLLYTSAYFSCQDIISQL